MAACRPQSCHLELGAQVEGLQAALAAKDRRIEDLRSAEAASDAQCQALQEQQKVRRPGAAPFALTRNVASPHNVMLQIELTQA